VNGRFWPKVAPIAVNSANNLYTQTTTASTHMPRVIVSAWAFWSSQRDISPSE